MVLSEIIRRPTKEDAKVFGQFVEPNRHQLFRDSSRRWLPEFTALAVSALQVVTNLTAAAESVPSADWRFDEATGSIATDSSGSGHTGTIIEAERVAGQTGGGLSFDGMNDYVFATDAQSGGTTGPGLDMGPSSQPLDFRKSTDNGASWSAPVRFTGPGQELRRANIVANGSAVHVFGGQSGAGGYGTGVFYFRSTDGGTNWSDGIRLFAEADGSAKMAVDGTTVHVCFGAKLTPNSFGGKSTYMRSTDNGQTWSEPMFIGEENAESNVQARQQIAAADGRVFAMWQREPIVFGGTLPPDRLGYNRSDDGGLTWTGVKLLPGDSGVNREHHHVWMIPGGALHVAWSHGNPGDASSPTGYKYSLDYGVTWSGTEIAISTSTAGNLPHGIVADTNWVHIIAEPGAGTYARRPAPRRLEFTSIEKQGSSLILKWTGQGLLQQTQDLSPPWSPIPTASSPYTINTDAATHSFFRLVSP